eukprot:COSAG02_NODE_5202_length_4546_cov_1.544862_5_plen_63_part_00
MRSNHQFSDRPRGPDARDGNFPLGTRVLNNIVNDIGIWQKQSSMWFQVRRIIYDDSDCSVDT